MNAQLMIQPSAFVEAGIQLQPVRNLYLFKFKFTDELQERLETLSQEPK